MCERSKCISRLQVSFWFFLPSDRIEQCGCAAYCSHEVNFKKIAQRSCRDGFPAKSCRLETVLDAATYLLSSAALCTHSVGRRRAVLPRRRMEGPRGLRILLTSALLSREKRLTRLKPISGQHSVGV